jgi:hypothetical protein
MNSEQALEVRCRYHTCRHPVPRAWHEGCEAHCFLHKRFGSDHQKIRQIFDL